LARSLLTRASTAAAGSGKAGEGHTEWLGERGANGRLSSLTGRLAQAGRRGRPAGS